MASQQRTEKLRQAASKEDLKKLILAELRLTSKHFPDTVGGPFTLVMKNDKTIESGGSEDAFVVQAEYGEPLFKGSLVDWIKLENLSQVEENHV